MKFYVFFYYLLSVSVAANLKSLGDINILCCVLNFSNFKLKKMQNATTKNDKFEAMQLWDGYLIYTWNIDKNYFDRKYHKSENSSSYQFGHELNNNYKFIIMWSEKSFFVNNIKFFASPFFSFGGHIDTNDVPCMNFVITSHKHTHSVLNLKSKLYQFQ